MTSGQSETGLLLPKAIGLRRLTHASLSRAGTLLVSGIPTLIAWSLISKHLPTEAFAGVALAVSLPTLLNFVLPAFGAQMANAAAVDSHALHVAVGRSIRANFLMGLVLLGITVGVTIVGDWNNLLGRNESDGFPMDAAVTSVSLVTAVWLSLLVGERLLIALGHTNLRVWASGTTGPVTLVLTLILFS